MSAGQRVVASGQFLIDSEASLSGALARLEASQAQPQAGAIHEARGRITALRGADITIAHGPVASLQWPAMTMAFRLERPELVRGLAVGDEVVFSFRQQGSLYIVSAIREAAR